MNLDSALDIGNIRSEMLRVFRDESFWDNVEDAEDGEEVWMLCNLVSSSAGVYQNKEIIELMGFDPESNDDEYVMQFAEEMTTQATELLHIRLKEAGLQPQGFRLAFGWWPEGCWGLIVYKEDE